MLPLMSSLPATASTASPPLAIGDFVLLHPWHLIGDYSDNLYAKVVKIEEQFMFVRTRATTGINPYAATSLRVPLGRTPPRRVSTMEVNGLRTGRMMYKAVMFEYAGEHVHGQVFDYTNKPPVVDVRSKSGLITVSATEVTEIPAPIAFLFFNQSWNSAVWTKERLVAAHASVLERIRNFDLNEPVDGLLDHAFQGVDTPPMETSSWLNVMSGEMDLCHPVHAALFVRLEVDWQTAPSGLVNLVGDHWSADPTCEPVDLGPDELTNEGPLTEATSPPSLARDPMASRIPALYIAQAKPKCVANSRSGVGPSEKAVPRTLPQEDNFSIHEEEIIEDDWDEGLSQTSEAVTRCLNNHMDLHPPEQSLRALLGVTDASFHDSGRRAKKLHYPSPLNNIMSRAFHSDKCNKMDAQSLMESFDGADLPWNVHPYMNICLRNAQYGITGVRGFMLRTVEARDRRAWTLQHAEHLQDYGENRKVFDLPVLTTKQELVEAYSNLIHYWERFGSELVKTFGYHLHRFLINLQSSDMPSLEEVNAHMVFIDSALSQFARAVLYDIRNDTATHKEVHLLLVKSNPELVKELAYLMNDRLRTLEASLSKRKPSEPTSGSLTKKPKKDSRTVSVKPKTTHKPHDDSVLYMVPKHEGKQVCLRHLSLTGCMSKHPTRCTNDYRVHHVPTAPLPAEVVKHMKEKWGGVSPNYQHLAP